MYNVTVLEISWNFSTFASCHFKFRVTISTITSDFMKTIETFETFTMFLNLQPRDYIISVTTRAGSCASDPVTKTFTLPVTQLKGLL